MGKKSQEHPYIPALNGEVLRTKHDKKNTFTVSLATQLVAKETTTIL